MSGSYGWSNQRLKHTFISPVPSTSRRLATICGPVWCCCRWFVSLHPLYWLWRGTIVSLMMPCSSRYGLSVDVSSGALSDLILRRSLSDVLCCSRAIMFRNAVVALPFVFSGFTKMYWVKWSTATIPYPCSIPVNRGKSTTSTCSSPKGRVIDVCRLRFQ